MKAFLKEKFNSDNQITNMMTTLNVITSESSKRGLADDLLYSVSNHAPEDLDEVFNHSSAPRKSHEHHVSSEAHLNAVQKKTTAPTPWRNQDREKKLKQ